MAPVKFRTASMNVSAPRFPAKDARPSASARRIRPDARGVAPAPAVGMVEIDPVPVPHQLGERLQEGPVGLAVHCLAEGRGQGALRVVVAAAENRQRDARTFAAFVEIPEQGDIAREPELEWKHLDESHQEAVERADQREMLRVDDLAQPCRGGGVRRRVLCQSRDESGEDLSGSGPGKRERDDLARGRALL